QVAVARVEALVGEDGQRLVTGVGLEVPLGDLQRAGVRRGPAQQVPAPEVRADRAPVVVLGGLVDGVVALDVVDREADRQRLDVVRLRLGRRAGLTGLGG